MRARGCRWQSAGREQSYPENSSETSIDAVTGGCAHSTTQNGFSLKCIFNAAAKTTTSLFFPSPFSAHVVLLHVVDVVHVAYANFFLELFTLLVDGDIDEPTRSSDAAWLLATS